MNETALFLHNTAHFLNITAHFVRNNAHFLNIRPVNFLIISAHFVNEIVDFLDNAVHFLTPVQLILIVHMPMIKNPDSFFRKIAALTKINDYRLMKATHEIEFGLSACAAPRWQP